MWSGVSVVAHITVVSPYTFNQHVLPILQLRCGACHRDGGVAPNPLTTYAEARGQLWWLRQVLMTGRMPPWFAESRGAAIKDSQALTGRELDVLMTWVAGGAPEGTAPPAANGPALRPRPDPDLVIPMPEPFTLDAQTPAADHEVVLPSMQVRGKSIRAVDVLPGSPAIVRRASVAIRTANREQMIGAWVPGDTLEMPEGNAAFRVPADGSLVIRIHYQHPRPDGATAVSDRTRVAIYFASGSAPLRIQTLDITTDVQTLERAARGVAIRPVSGPANARATLVLVDRQGVRTPLLTLQLSQDWPRRYLLAAPVPLPQGSRIETTLDPTNRLLWRQLAGDRPNPDLDGRKFHVALEIID